VEWAAAAIETSSNQPILPHAIIVLNASEHEINPVLWNVNTNTSTILDDLANTVDRNETFKKYTKFWRSRGRTIDTLEQLVASYYSSIQVGSLETVNSRLVSKLTRFRFFEFQRMDDPS
jgi:hypothetical protein